MKHTHMAMDRLINTIGRSGNPDEPFFYLGGPMTGIPQFNFPRFKQVANDLRERGYNIISPAELDDPEIEAAVMQSEDGAPGTGGAGEDSHADFLARDLIIVSLPQCKGGIFIEGWQNSRGAAAETWVLAFLGRELYSYEEAYDGTPCLRRFERDKELAWLLDDPSVAGTVPTDRPGIRTVEARQGTHAGRVACAEPNLSQWNPAGMV